MAAATLDSIRAECDAADIEFTDFAALDEIILATGEAEQNRVALAKRQRIDTESTDYEEPLEGEQGSVVDAEGTEDAKAAALCCAAGAYFALFERPLLALGAYRHAYTQVNPRSAVAACGMASCLQTIGRQAAAAALALDYWSTVGMLGRPASEPSPGAPEAHGSLLFLLAESAALLPPPSSPQPLLQAVVPMLKTGAAGAARSVLRRWLPDWAAGRGGLAALLLGEDHCGEDEEAELRAAYERIRALQTSATDGAELRSARKRIAELEAAVAAAERRLHEGEEAQRIDAPRLLRLLALVVVVVDHGRR